MRVVKFGGSSLANGSQFAKVVAIMKANPARRVMVTSAPGKRHPGDVKVTDLLIQYAQAFLRHENATEVVKKIVARYQAISYRKRHLPITIISWPDSRPAGKS